jgi:glutamate-ammonia-ligase adenylyltransferase
MVSDKRGWSAETFFARFTQKLITALASPTPAGTLYEVDMRLRPSGAAGPVAVSLPRFEHYYQGEAETWEFLALTRARVVWATSPNFAAEVTAAIETALRQPRDLAKTLKAVREMRSLMAKERPPSGPWDLKLGPGGLVDVEFAAQALQLRNAQSGGPLSANTAEALDALHRAGLLDEAAYDALHAAWDLQQSLTQVLKLALPENTDPSKEPPKFRALLARAAGTKDFRILAAELKRVQAAAHTAFRAAASS